MRATSWTSEWRAPRRRRFAARNPFLLPHSRVLTWDGCVNVRDLGGHPTDEGRTTRFGAVVRADSVRQLSDDGWAALLGYGVSRIVDLRFQMDLEADPPRELDVEVVHVPLLPEPDDGAWEEIDAVGDAAPEGDLQRREPRPGPSR